MGIVLMGLGPGRSCNEVVRPGTGFSAITGCITIVFALLLFAVRIAKTKWRTVQGNHEEGKLLLIGLIKNKNNMMLHQLWLNIKYTLK